jgi:tetratricopeptide (TPR) repeat protein
MRLRKPNPPANASPKGPATAPPRPERRARRLWLAVGVAVPVLALAGWAAWSASRPDHLRDAHTALEKRDFATASAALARHLTDNPADADARLLAARTARRAGELSAAADHLKLHAQRHGTNEAAALESGLLAAHAGNRSEAERLFAIYRAQADSPDAPFVMEAYLETTLKTLAPTPDVRFDAERDDPEAVARLHAAADQWLRSRPGAADQVQGLVWRGRVHLYARQQPECVAALREALARDPDHFDARFHLALALASEAPAEAADHLEVLLQRRPDDRRLRYFLATARRTLGHLAEARRLLDNMLAENPRDVSALVELAHLNMDEQKISEAEKLLGQALALAPDMPEPNIAMSRCQQLASRPDEAARYRKRFEEIESRRRQPNPAPKP